MAGCSPSKPGSDPVDPPAPPDPVQRDWVDERDYGYTCFLEKPSDVVHNGEELKAICDYYAFYKKENFSVTIADDYQYSVKNKHNIKTELNYLYWNNELINGVMGMNAVANGNKWDFTYTIYHNAYKDSTPMVENGIDVSFTVGDYNSDITFATDNKDLPICDVATTQQLYYAAEHNYQIRCIATSAAEKYYNKSKELLNKIIDESMSDEEKFSILYDYISHVTVYDFKAVYYGEEPKNPALYPDEFCSGDKCFFIEGLFDNNLLVCDGFAKTLTLFGKMLGINIVRASGINDYSYSSREAAGHAYCFVELGGQWHLSDITWGQGLSFNNLKFTNHSTFLGSHALMDPYQSVEWPEIQRYLPQTKVDYDGTDLYITRDIYSNQEFTVNGKTYSRLITNENYMEYDFETLLPESGTYVDLFLEDISIFSKIEDVFGFNVNQYDLKGIYEIVVINIWFI